MCCTSICDVQNAQILIICLGRFPQVSNIRFKFDPSRPPQSRVLSVEIDGKPIDHKRLYTVVTRGYMARGKDGYTDLLSRPEGGECEEVVSEESGMLISTMLRQYFMALKVVRRWSNWGPSMARHWGEVVTNVCKCHPVMQPKSSRRPPQQCGAAETAEGCIHGKRKCAWDEWTPAKLRQRRGSMPPVDEAEDSDEEGETADGDADQAVLEKELRIMRRVFKQWCRRAGVRGQTCDDLREAECEVEWTKAIAPKLEGRIQMVGEKER